MIQTKTAIITGATSGIGASFARVFAQMGYNLFLTGRRIEKINAFAAELREAYGVSVRVSITEFSDAGQINRLIEEIETIPIVSVLINNAGFGNAGLFADAPERHYAMLMVHVAAAVRLSGAVVPRMVHNGEGMIINVASVAAFFPMPGSASYSSSKRYLVTFSESLHMELSTKGIRVQALCPGMTRTDFHDRRGTEDDKIRKRYFLGWMDPDTVVRRSLRHLDSGNVVYVPGLVNKLIVRLVSRLPKRLYYRLASKIRRA
jgi:short-subunit dehydrogenase